MRILSQRERRLMALGGLVLAIGLAWVAVIDPIAAGFAQRTEARAQLQVRYDHAEQTIASLPRLRRMARQSDRQTRAFVVRAASADAAGVAMEDRLRAGIEAVGGSYVGGDHEGTVADRVHARAVAQMPVEKLVVWLARLENEQPYVVVEQLGLGADAALASQKAETLDVKIEISIPFVRTAA